MGKGLGLMISRVCGIQRGARALKSLGQIGCAVLGLWVGWRMDRSPWPPISIRNILYPETK